MTLALDASLQTDLCANSEQELVIAAAEGCMRSYERLYRTYSQKIFLLCLRMTGRKELAEEHMQEAFIKAWQALKKFEGKSKFSTWIYRIAVNVVLGYQRKYHLEMLMIDDNQLEFVECLRTTHTDSQIDLEKAVAMLPAQAKNVLILHDMMGMTHKEIGESLGIASGTCKAHLNRARTLLKEQLEAHERDE